MKLGTVPGATRDGRLVLVAGDLAHAAPVVEPLLRAEYDQLGASKWVGAGALDPATLLAPLPRAWQFIDGSAFLAHNNILADAWGYSKRTESDPPLMYQGVANQFYSATEDIGFRSEADEIDFEAEFGVILDDTAMGISAAGALAHVKLIVIVNDWSLRAFGPGEMKGGFGFLQAKPPSSLSPVAVTPDELGEAWSNGRVCLPLEVYRGEKLFGKPHGRAMTYGFGELIAHAALTRDLCAGTVIGSGTIANFDANEVGCGCIAERRALDTIGKCSILTPYLGFKERVRLNVVDKQNRSLFGGLDQQVTKRC